MKIKALKTLIYGLSVFVICFSIFISPSQASIKNDTLVNSGFKIKTIVVDAGHGERPSGGGRYSPGASGTYSLERTVTLAIAQKLQKAIEKNIPDVKVVMTRTTPEDVPFQKRADIANQNKGDLFISIHCNALPNKTVRQVVGRKKGKPVYKSVSVPDRSGKGVLMLLYSTDRTAPQIEALLENAEIGGNPNDTKAAEAQDPQSIILINLLKNKYRKQSIHLANLLNQEFIMDGRKSEGLREQVLFVLDHTAMPSVLVETGYINNKEEEDYLNSEEGQEEVANAILRGIENYKRDAEKRTE
ncbi:MAG: N-acetylmuramoyl-L-alanine amidase [Sphingobacteriaceae bacterium]|nr:MAG: N-acetylmuramoyl-L-alanine amidase [Sphingobacteriaceae bacterium]